MRIRFGKALTPDRIELALRQAQLGAMRELTDISRETIDTDPHLAAVLAKRFGALTALPYEIVPANGEGVDQKKAEEYASFVREQISKIPRFGLAVERLAWGLFDGRAALELEWREYKGKFAVSGLAWIHPRRIHFGPERELRVHDLPAMQGFQPIGIALREVPWKFVEFLPSLFGDYPEREGLGPRCLYWSFFKRFGARERMILLEQYGKPWRTLTIDEESTADPDDIEQADEILENLPITANARLPRGTELNVHAPNRAAGQIHQEVIEESDRQISKLVLGQTGTTDGTAAGMNSSQAMVMRGEQDLIRARDAHLISEALEDGLTDAIIAVNFGEDELPHAPRFRIRSDVPVDREAEVRRVKAAAEAGLSVSLQEAYEVSGFRTPRNDEPVIRLETPPTHPAAVQAQPARPVVIYPDGKVPDPGKQVGIAESVGGIEPLLTPPEASGQPAANDTEADPSIKVEDVPEGALPEAKQPLEITPSDLASIVTVNEGRANIGLPELTLPDGSRDPDGDLTIAEYRAKKEAAGAAMGAEVGAVEGRESVGLPAEAPAPAGPPGGGGFPNFSKSPVSALLAGAGFSDEAATRLAKIVTAPDPIIVYPEEIRLAKHPTTLHGSVDRIVSVGIRTGSVELGAWVSAFAKGVSGKDSPEAIEAALRETSQGLTLSKFAVNVERTLTRSLMMGALDSKGDRGELEGREEFDSMPYKDAIAHFKAKAPVTKDVFEKLRIAAKRRSFTVAGNANDTMVQTFQRELVRHLADGKQLRDFRDAVEQRAELAGWTPANPSHVETIYRTNTLDAYNSGRIKEMSQPAVLKGRPYWQWRAVADSRSRQAHRDAHLKVLPASDPFWTKASAPAGFNCRCRLVSLSEAAVKARGLEVTNGAGMPGLPDPGFVAGSSAMIAGDA